MEIVEYLNKENIKELKDLYYMFFKETNFNNNYSDKDINLFVKKKMSDLKSFFSKGKYYFCLVDGVVVGFIQGKIIDNVGLICHLYIKNDYRNKGFLINLYKSIIEWFKRHGINTVEVEVDINNPIISSFERHDWQLVRNFDDANIYQRKI